MLRTIIATIGLKSIMPIRAYFLIGYKIGSVTANSDRCIVTITFSYLTIPATNIQSTITLANIASVRKNINESNRAMNISNKIFKTSIKHYCFPNNTALLYAAITALSIALLKPSSSNTKMASAVVPPGEVTIALNSEGCLSV